MLVITNDRPAYRILSEQGFFAPNDTLYREGQVIYFDGEPNEEMEPLNDLAKKRQKALFNKLDNLGAEVAKVRGLKFAGRRPTAIDMEAAARADSRRVELIKGDGGVPLMAGKTGRENSVSEAIDPDPPQTGQKAQPLSVAMIPG